MITLDDGTEALFEAKSMNKTKFNAFVKHGINSSHAHYYMQLQMLMGLLSLEKAVIVGYCKDNSEYHHEWISKDLFAFEAQTVRIGNVMFGDPAKVAKDRSDYRCKMCFKNQACWHEAPVEEICSTCQHGEPDMDRNDGAWRCSLNLIFVEGCSSWKRYRPKDRK